MTLFFVALISGCLMGWGACDTNYRARKEVVKNAHKREMDEVFDEVRRLRTQVAGMIGLPVTPVLSRTDGRVNVLEGEGLEASHRRKDRGG